MTAANNKGVDGNARPAKPVPCDRRRILIADDEASIRNVFMTVVGYSLHNVRVDVAVNGNEAVEAFRHVHHGVIIMDVRMPVMDGEQAFDEIRRLCRQENWEMPCVIFCTGFVPPHALKNVTSGNSAHCIIQKPVDNETLLDAIRLRLDKGAGS